MVLIDLLWIVNRYGFFDWGFCEGMEGDGLRKAFKTEVRRESKDLLSDWRSWTSGEDLERISGSGEDLEILNGNIQGSKRFDYVFHIRSSEISSLIWVFPRLFFRVLRVFFLV